MTARAEVLILREVAGQLRTSVRDKIEGVADWLQRFEDAAVRVGLRQRFDELDALLDLSNPAVFAARRELGKAVGAALDNSTVSAKSFPPYGEQGALTEPPAPSPDYAILREAANWLENQEGVEPDWDGVTVASRAEMAAAIQRAAARLRTALAIRREDSNG